MRKLSVSFFLRPDVTRISRELLGKILLTRIGHGPVTGGVIVETEAYSGVADRASHAYGNRRTKRTEVMFRCGGIAYIYLCYGIHSLFNIITNEKDIPDAVLIRAIQPVHGIQVMLKRRRKTGLNHLLTAGPGVLSQALGIGLNHNGISVTGNIIWLESGIRIQPAQIASGPRIGIQYAGEDARRSWRFWVRDSEWVRRVP